MDVQAFIVAQGAYQSWENSHPNASSDAKEEALQMSQSPQFQNWIKQNPQGSLEQYIILVRQQEAYLNSPQYQIEMLRAQINTQAQTIYGLQEEVTNLQQEISYLEEENAGLSHTRNLWGTITVILLIFIAFLLISAFRSHHSFKNILKFGNKNK